MDSDKNTEDSNTNDVNDSVPPSLDNDNVTPTIDQDSDSDSEGDDLVSSEETEDLSDVKTDDPAAVPEATPSAGDVDLAPSEPTPVSPASPTLSTAPKKQKKGLLVSILLVIVIIIVAAALTVYFVHKHNQKKAVEAAAAMNISHLNVGIEGGDLGTKLYPNNDDSDSALLANTQMFDGLTKYINQSTIVPDIASGWTNPNGSTWIFTIKQGIKFHDGHTLTPSDVVYSLNLMKNESVNTSNSEFAQTFASTLQTITPVGSTQVKIVTTQPDPSLLNKLTFLYIIDKNLPKGDEASQAGTGPYEITPGTKFASSRADMTAVSNYYGGKIYTKSLSLYDVASNAALFAGYKNHKYDIIGQIPAANVNLAGAYKFIEQDNTVSFLGLNTTSGPLSNILVREAIRDALNVAAIGAPGDYKAIPIGQLIPPSIPGYNPAIAPVKQNITEAKELLAQAGYPNGLTLTMNAATTSVSTPIIYAQLKQVGINVKVIPLDLGDEINNFIAGNGQMFDLGYSSSSLDGADVLESTIIPANYNNTTLNNLINQAADTVDPASRIKSLQQADSIISQNVAAVPFYYSDQLWLMNKPYVLHQDLQSAYISTYFYKVHLK
jgi:peptide/nickel transport system substrate-binding protein